MDADKVKREAGALDLFRDRPNNKRHVVIAPTVTRKPVYDAMLSDAQIVAQYILEGLRNKSLNRLELSRQDLRDYKEIAETVVKQVRLEMEVERHVEQRAKTQDRHEVAVKIAKRLREKLVTDEIILIVLEELGLEIE